MEKKYKYLIRRFNKMKKIEEIKEIFIELALNKMENEELENIYNFMLANYNKIKPVIFAEILRYLYSSDIIAEFRLYMTLIKNKHSHIKIMPTLHDFILPEDKFMDFLPVLIYLVSKCKGKIRVNMYMILIRHSDYFSKISMEDSDKIMRSLSDIDKYVDYLSKGNNINKYPIRFELEIMIDVAKYFNNQTILYNVLKSLKLNDSEIKLFSLNTLVYNNMFVKEEYIEEVAKNISTAARLYVFFTDMNKKGMFPEKYLSQEYLAKSNMVYWLMYPSELGNEPDEIEFVDTVEENNLVYYIFKFKSIFKRHAKNKWMIGIGGGYVKEDIPCAKYDGYVYSNYEIFDDVNYKMQVEEIFKMIKEYEKNIPAE
ncbi:MAG: hypothetical protein N2749_07335 [Clostridia bacterium]|nr:hypothetical protein [Clostridia bacterium]